jgi:hypothetical protein
MKIPNKLPFWVIFVGIDGRVKFYEGRDLFLITEYKPLINGEWCGFWCTDSDSYCYNSFRDNKINCWFDKEMLEKGSREATKEEIEKGKKLLEKWKEQAMIDNL